MSEHSDGDVRVKFIRSQHTAVPQDRDHNATSARVKIPPKLLAVTCESCRLAGPSPRQSRELSPRGTSPFIRLPPPSSPALPYLLPCLPSPDPAIWGKQMILMRDGSPSPGTERALVCAPPLIVRHRPRCPAPDTDTVCCANTMNGTWSRDNR